MKITNIKHLVLCLFWGIGCHFANAQGLAVHMKDGTSIIVPYEQLDSISTYVSEEESASVIGIWRCNTDDGYKTLTFNRNGTGVEYEYWEYDQDSESTNFTWKTKGDVLTFVYDDGENSVITCTYVVSPEILIINWGQDSETYVKSAGDNGGDDNGGYETVDVSGTIGGHDYVDLGLPSGTLWATCNVGASSPDEYGGYFAWGEINTKSEYSWSTYKWCNGSSRTMTKYCNNSISGYNGFTDDKTSLEVGDDAAVQNWGSSWRMPSNNQLIELINSRYTTSEWTTLKGVYGRMITSKINGNLVFLPAAGFFGEELKKEGSIGHYWSRTLQVGHRAHELYFNNAAIRASTNEDFYFRYYGQSVRPVVNRK